MKVELDWYRRWATAVLDGTCIPCPECEHEHTCFWCVTIGVAPHEESAVEAR